MKAVKDGQLNFTPCRVLLAQVHQEQMANAARRTIRQGYKDRRLIKNTYSRVDRWPPGVEGLWPKISENQP